MKFLGILILVSLFDGFSTDYHFMIRSEFRESQENYLFLFKSKYKILMSKSSLQLTLSLTLYDTREDLSEMERKLLQTAENICAKAYAPYSGFFVGAALLLANGMIVEGVNQENAAYPSGLCAERVALFASGVQYPEEKIQMMAIAARKSDETIYTPVSPCGACRQVISEFEEKQKQTISILFQGEKNKIYKVDSVKILLPFRFGSDNLI